MCLLRKQVSYLIHCQHIIAELNENRYEVIPGILTLDDPADPAFFQAAYEEYLADAIGPLATTGASSGLLSCPQIGCGNLKSPSSFSPNLRPGVGGQYQLLSKYFQPKPSHKS
jgi:hypothetical protein